MLIDVGQTIAGKYLLTSLLGSGAFGEVWAARHASLGEEVAIKLLTIVDGDKPMESPEKTRERFQFEARVAAKLSRKSRHIVQVTDHGEEDGLPYLVMEKLEGESLDDRLRRDGAMTLDEVIAIVSQVARGLGQAHAEGILHRDLKPGNIFLTKDDEGRLLVKILDFGIARLMEGRRTRPRAPTTKGMILGTPCYMSPEHARGLPSTDHRADLWSLAVVAYEALAGSIPFAGESTEDIFLSVCLHQVEPIRGRRPDLTPSVEAFFARAFTMKLEERFQTAEDLSTTFAALGGDRQLPAPVPSLPARRKEEVQTKATLAVAVEPRDLGTAPTVFAPAAGRGRTAGIVLLGVVTVVCALIGGRVLFSRGASPAASPAAPEEPVTTTRAPDRPVSAPPAPPSATATEPAKVIAAPARTTAPRTGAPRIAPIAAATTTPTPAASTPPPPSATAPPPATAPGTAAPPAAPARSADPGAVL